MALEVEDGTGKTNAVSYVSVANADAYFAVRGSEAWANAETSDKETALVRATFALDSWCRGRWVGTKKTREQSLAWPRTGAVDEEGFDLPIDAVPVEVIQTCSEIALIELSERFLQQSVSKDNAIASESVGPISVSYRDYAPSVKKYPHIEAMLRGLAAVGGVQVGFGVSLTQEEIDALENSGNTSVFDYPAYFEIVKWS